MPRKGEELSHECYVTPLSPGCTAGAVCLICPVWAGLGLV